MTSAESSVSALNVPVVGPEKCWVKLPMWSQPAPRPKYQPVASLATAEPVRASAATPARAIIRIFILPSFFKTDGQGPPYRDVRDATSIAFILADGEMECPSEARSGAPSGRNSPRPVTGEQQLKCKALHRFPAPLPDEGIVCRQYVQMALLFREDLQRLRLADDFLARCDMKEPKPRC